MLAQPRLTRVPPSKRNRNPLCWHTDNEMVWQQHHLHNYASVYAEEKAVISSLIVALVSERSVPSKFFFS